MSIAATMQEAAALSGEARRRTARSRLLRGRTRTAVAPQPRSSIGAIASDLTRYIPTEAVALYTGILPFLVPKSVPLREQSFGSRWALAISVGVAAVLYGVGLFKREVEARHKAFHWPVRRTAIIIVAYIGWVFVIPGSPLNAFSWYTPSLGAAIGIAANAAITLGVLWFGAPEDAEG